MKVTWTVAANPKERRTDDSGIPFKVTHVDPTTGIRWEVEVFSGAISCVPYDNEKGSYRHDVSAAFTLYTPKNQVSPEWVTPRMIVRSPETVAHFGGPRMRLNRGHAVVAGVGIGFLTVSWDYPEFEHPKPKK